jgi:hypothetical protein
MLAAQLALIVAALFAEAAIYINLAEQPARLDLGDKGPFTEWSTIKRGRISHSKEIVRTHVPGWVDQSFRHHRSEECRTAHCLGQA